MTGKSSAIGRRLGRIGAGLLIVSALMAIFAPLLTGHDPLAASGVPYQSPSAAFPLGTDDVGHDLFAQLLYGARISLSIGLLAAVLATLIGLAVGVVAGYFRGRVEGPLMRLVDLTLALPFFVLVIVLAAFFGRGLLVTVVGHQRRDVGKAGARALLERRQGTRVPARRRRTRDGGILGPHPLAPRRDSAGAARRAGISPRARRCHRAGAGAGPGPGRRHRRSRTDLPPGDRPAGTCRGGAPSGLDAARASCSTHHPGWVIGSGWRAVGWIAVVTLSWRAASVLARPSTGTRSRAPSASSTGTPARARAVSAVSPAARRMTPFSAPV